MGNILENIRAWNEAYEKVVNHPLCGRIEIGGGKVMIIYPAGDFAVDGVQVPRSAAMLDKALEIMERHWMESYPGGTFGKG